MKDESEFIKLNQIKWDRWSATLDNNNWKYKYLRQAQQDVIDIINFKEDVHFLDVGCGTGWAVGQAIKAVNGNGIFYGVDLSEKMIEKANMNFGNISNAYFIKANAESIPLEENFFDFIICTNSFHHYLNPGMVMNEFYRLLKTGGRVYILDPTADSIFMKLIDKIARLTEPEHVKMYSTLEYSNLFISAELKYFETKTISNHQKVHIGEK